MKPVQLLKELTDEFPLLDWECSFRPPVSFRGTLGTYLRVDLYSVPFTSGTGRQWGIDINAVPLFELTGGPILFDWYPAKAELLIMIEELKKTLKGDQ